MNKRYLFGMILIILALVLALLFVVFKKNHSNKSSVVDNVIRQDVVSEQKVNQDSSEENIEVEAKKIINKDTNEKEKISKEQKDNKVSGVNGVKVSKSEQKIIVKTETLPKSPDEKADENVGYLEADVVKKSTIKDRINNLMSYEIKDFAKEQVIIEALMLLKQNGYEDLFRDLEKYAIRIKFDDMGMLSYNSQNCHAATVFKNYTNRLIIINSRYKTVPPEQIACLIVHEISHLKKENEVKDEVRAIKAEALCWSKLKQKDKSYPQNKLTKRLDYIVDLVKQPDDILYKKVSNTDFYRSQFK